LYQGQFPGFDTVINVINSIRYRHWGKLYKVYTGPVCTIFATSCLPVIIPKLKPQTIQWKAGKCEEKKQRKDNAKETASKVLGRCNHNELKWLKSFIKRYSLIKLKRLKLNSIINGL
jgi:hypothetical protein